MSWQSLTTKKEPEIFQCICVMTVEYIKVPIFEVTGEKDHFYDFRLLYFR